MGYLHHIHNLNRMYLKYSFIFYFFKSNDDCEVLLCLLIIFARKEAH
ncbi:hypothetical protein NP493_429g00000 [Ridgeia piscesae]|uniref:Uncharacterized protein n=1 Tax=Ridgeia piscesae TaxID=27915 RepID=A0AAD9NU30_RIDPI|nr:hypothetical protein NP493_429g00000 [Ridgeia piscesae]